MALLIIVILRLFVPLLILRRPLVGGLLALVLDIADYGIYGRWGWGFLEGPGLRYQYLDKVLDTYYLCLEVYMVRNWLDPVLRNTLYALFSYRFIGACIFFVVPHEVLLFIFPNIFENVFLLMLIFGQQRKKVHPTTLLLIIGVSLVHKLPLEYSIHVEPLEFQRLFGELLGKRTS